MNERGSVAAGETPLAAVLIRRIAATGPISVRAYMEICLSDPEHGYYRTQPAIGAAADFITAPEISQIFGELLGLWSAVVWQQMGAPSPFRLVEIGPGRGTMMADALRAAQRVPGFADAVRVILVEPSPVLQTAQRRKLEATTAQVEWVEDMARVAPGPTVLLANEFFDAIPMTQLIRCEDGWRERMVALDQAAALSFAVDRSLWRGALPEAAATASTGSVLELRDLSGLSQTLQRMADGGPLAALFIDYGHEATGFGDTLQAVRRHRSESVLASPGAADLTAMVDFEAAERCFASDRIAVEPLSTQAEFLGALGIAERASRLMTANPSRAGEIEAAVARLMSPHGMGTRFKVLGVRSSQVPGLPGFARR
ncbi:MAG: class I SAM-dependent methyltransferase [Hyphomicrobiaceae bacterium]